MQFDMFRQEYEAWEEHTRTLPIRREQRPPTSAFELDLDHLIDHVRSLRAIMAAAPTQLDYRLVAAECFNDLERISDELNHTLLADADRHVYVNYIREFRALVVHLGSLPVRAEGHLGFRGHALRCFRFLVERYGFELADSSPIHVRFTTDALFVELSYSPEHPMSTLTVGGRASGGDATTTLVLDDFAYVDDRRVLFNYDEFDLRQEIGVAGLLEATASILRRTGDMLLRGSPNALTELLKAAAERERAYIRLMEQEESGDG